MKRDGKTIVATKFFHSMGMGTVNNQHEITYATKATTPAGEYTFTVSDSSNPRKVFATYTFVVKEDEFVVGGHAWAVGASLSDSAKKNVQIMLSRDGSVGVDGTADGVSCSQRATYLTKAELDEVMKSLSNSDITLVKLDANGDETSTTMSLDAKAIEVLDYDEKHTSADAFYGRGFGFLKVYLANVMTNADNGNWAIKIYIDRATISIPLTVAGIS